MTREVPLPVAGGLCLGRLRKASSDSFASFIFQPFSCKNYTSKYKKCKCEFPNANFLLTLLSYLRIASACEVPDEEGRLRALGGWYRKGRRRYTQPYS